MAIDKADLASTMNQFKLNNMTNLFGNAANANSGPISGDIIQQWNQRGANGAAYRKLLEAQKTGSIKPQDPNNYELMSDRFFNDSYEKDENGKISYTYKPEKVTTAADGDLVSQLESMKNIASAAAGNPGSINENYTNLFNTMRQNIANALVTKAGADSTTSTTATEAQSAKLTSKVNFRYLEDAQNFTLAGKTGEKTYAFEAGASMNQIADAINADSDATGVKAEVVLDASGNAVNINVLSTATGKDAFLRIDQNVGTMFTSSGGTTSAAGVDATKTDATVVAKGGDAKAALATGAYGGKVSGDQEFTITGAKGSKKFSFSAETSIEDIATAINAASESLGVTASIIKNSAGGVDGLGLESTELGQHQFINVEQQKGYLFTAPGQKVSVYGKSENPEGANAVNSLAQFGRVNWGGESFSFADLAPGGKVTLEKNPDIAGAILDQALRDVFGGAAALKGVDAEKAITEHAYIPNKDDRMGSSPINSLGLNDFGSAAIAKWVADRVVKEG